MKTLFKIKAKPLLLDSSNVVFRALSVRPDGYLYLFCKMLINYRKDFPFHHFVFATEGKNGTVARKKLFPDYKHNRVLEPEAKQARKTCQNLYRFLSCSVVNSPKGEADDAIGCYIKRHPGAGTVIISEDKDLWQLIRPGKVSVLTRKRGVITPEVCKSVVGVKPSQVPLHKALLGDSSDNLPRVPRVPKKVLLSLASTHRTPKELFQTLQENEIPHYEAILRCKKQIRRVYKAARIQRKLEMNETKYEANPEKLARFLEKHGATLPEPDLNKLVGEQRR
jgi:DNA polymerase-1